MPQMMPLNWINLFIFILFIFYWFNSLNYFFKNYLPMKQLISKKTMIINWKW